MKRRFANGARLQARLAARYGGRDLRWRLRSPACAVGSGLLPVDRLPAPAMTFTRTTGVE